MSATLHATTVAIGDIGVLILGPSGSGKSALALQLMALGARLVADDQTVVTSRPQGLIARCPPTGRGLIEARGVGILRAPPLDEAVVALVVDLALCETERLPPRRKITLHGHDIDLVHGGTSAHFPSSIWCYVTSGRQE
jgi:HPr kinase/phosphorylase